jgi:hypothetical protein
LFTVKTQLSYHAKRDFIAGPSRLFQRYRWRILRSASFIGGELLQELDVAIGLSNSSWETPLFKPGSVGIFMSMEERYKHLNPKEYARWRRKQQYV